MKKAGSNKVLTKDKERLVLAEFDDTSVQKFKLILECDKILDEGVYQINSKLSNSLVMSFSNDNIVSSLSDNSYSQLFTVKYLNGYYQIISYENEKFLSTDGENVFLSDDEYRWIIKKNTDGTYLICSLDNGCVDVYGASVKAGTNIHLYSKNNTLAQKFIFNLIDLRGVDDGFYNILSFANDQLAVSLDGFVAYDGLNVLLKKKANINNQKWYIKNIKENVYEIKSALSDNYVLDVYGGRTDNFINVQLCKTNDISAQKWRIMMFDDGSYRLTNVKSGKNLDIYGGNIEDGVNIHQYENNNTNAQMFKFEKTDLLSNKQIIDNGNYLIYTSLNLNKTVSCNSNVFITDVTGFSNEIINIEYKNNGFYVLKNNSKVLTNNNNIILSNYIEADNQLWYLVKVSNYYTFYSKKDGKVLDLYGAITTNGNKLHTYISNDTLAQRFFLEKLGNEKVKDDYYEIVLDNQRLSFEGNVPFNFANVSMRNKSDNSVWYFKNISDNLYEIRCALNKNKTLDVYGGRVNNGTNVDVYSLNSTLAERWYLINLADGNYKFISAKSHKPLTITSDNAVIFSNDYSKKQKFELLKTEALNFVKNIDEGYYTIANYSSKKMIDVKAAGIASLTNVWLYSFNNSLAQIWKLKYLDNGLYAIISALNPKRALTNYNGNVVINKYSLEDNQKWYIEEVDDHVYSFVSYIDGRYLDVYGGYAADGTNVHVYMANGTVAQKFKLAKYSGVKTYKGIDISKWQGNIDFSLLVRNNPGFIIMRIGRGIKDLGKDVKFEEYYTKASYYDIPIGVYIYSFASNINEALEESNYVLSWLDDKDLDLPVFYDMEYSGQLYLGKDVLTRLAETFCTNIISNNYHCGIYANIYWYTNFLDGKKLSENYPIWLAHWTGASDYNLAVLDKYQSTYNLSNYKYWQFTSSGIYPGITENTVDLDFGYDIFD